MRKKVVSVILSAVLLTALFPVQPAMSVYAQEKVSTSTSLVLLYLNNKEAFINQDKVTLDAPATIIRDKMFVPAKFLGDLIGIPVTYDAATHSVSITTPNSFILIDLTAKTVMINGLPVLFEDFCAIVNNRLLVKLTWLADEMKVRYSYNSELRRVEMLVAGHAAGVVNGQDGNSKPVAKFTLGKQVYRIGEPVKYINLSYDPDAEGLAKLTWTGKEEAFFAAGTYPVTLQVTDPNGHVSEMYTKNVVVSEELYMDRLQYDVHFKPLGSFIKMEQADVKDQLVKLGAIAKKSTPIEKQSNRRLLVSDSPETFSRHGILYQDTVNGKARLYANHVNGMTTVSRFFILATNQSDQPVTIKTTNKGEVYPSLYANLFGHNASVDFLLDETNEKEMTVPAGESYIYVRMPDLKPNQGINAMYDVETSGEVQFSFLAVDGLTVPESPDGYPLLPYEGHVRGTFEHSESNWTLDFTKLDAPKRLIIGNGVDDPFVKGYDPMRATDTVNRGNYGVVYHFEGVKPPKMAILLLARGGIFKGPFKINGEMVLAPQSGVMTAFDGVQLLARTTGKEETLTIEFTPPAASAFPVDIIFYPLEDL